MKISEFLLRIRCYNDDEIGEEEFGRARDMPRRQERYMLFFFNQNRIGGYRRGNIGETGVSR